MFELTEKIIKMCSFKSSRERELFAYHRILANKFVNHIFGLMIKEAV